MDKESKGINPFVRRYFKVNKNVLVRMIFLLHLMSDDNDISVHSDDGVLVLSYRTRIDAEYIKITVPESYEPDKRDNGVDVINLSIRVSDDAITDVLNIFSLNDSINNVHVVSDGHDELCVYFSYNTKESYELMNRLNVPTYEKILLGNVEIRKQCGDCDGDQCERR